MKVKDLLKELRRYNADDDISLDTSGSTDVLRIIGEFGGAQHEIIIDYKNGGNVEIPDFVAPDQWWCDTCRIIVEPECVTSTQRHDERCGGCGDMVW